MGVTRPTIVVVYKKKWGNKVYIKVFTDQPTPDKIILENTKLLPKGAEILDLGVGESFINRYKKKHKL
jgi:hypothetical protein